MKLYLIRHGTSTRKAQGMWGRNFDAPLSKDHLLELDQSREIILSLAALTTFSSPLLRCRQSLEYVMQSKWPIQIIEEFRAYHSGQFENKTESFVKENFPHYLDLSYAQKFNNPKFDEESIAQQTLRVRRGLLRMLDMPMGETVAICSHFSVIKIIYNLVARNFDVSSYGIGDLEVLEGGIIPLDIDVNHLISDLKT